MAEEILCEKDLQKKESNERGGAMPTVTCKCGATTNSTCSNYWLSGRKDGKADGCYAKQEKGQWVKGCSYDKADGFDRMFADKLIAAREKEAP
jgi:hypothetical protein|tara:strand:+ start:7418 stop:7696 length:279 start_codon:yes stop_codon:yes gene_type:complete